MINPEFKPKYQAAKSMYARSSTPTAVKVIRTQHTSGVVVRSQVSAGSKTIPIAEI